MSQNKYISQVKASNDFYKYICYIFHFCIRKAVFASCPRVPNHMFEYFMSSKHSDHVGTGIYLILEKNK